MAKLIDKIREQLNETPETMIAVERGHWELAVELAREYYQNRITELEARIADYEKKEQAMIALWREKLIL